VAVSRKSRIAYYSDTCFFSRLVTSSCYKEQSDFDRGDKGANSLLLGLDSPPVGRDPFKRWWNRRSVANFRQPRKARFRRGGRFY